MICFFFQAEDGIRDLVRSRGLGDVYKRQLACRQAHDADLVATDDEVATVDVRRCVGAEIDHQLSLIHI